MMSLNINTLMLSNPKSNQSRKNGVKLSYFGSKKMKNLLRGKISVFFRAFSFTFWGKTIRTPAHTQVLQVLSCPQDWQASKSSGVGAISPMGVAGTGRVPGIISSKPAGLARKGGVDAIGAAAWREQEGEFAAAMYSKQKACLGAQRYVYVCECMRLAQERGASRRKSSRRS